MTSTDDLEFTEHAAACFSERTLPLMLPLNIYYRPLLNELNSDAYNDVEQLVKNTFPNCNVSQIRLVCAPQLYGMYMLRKEEMNLAVGQRVQEKLLFHVTTESRAMESLDCGLDWRRTRRNKFGRGVSFSDDADYANYYANKSPSEETRVIMICWVLVGETYVVPRQREYAGRSLVVPPGCADTTMSHNGRVYVKYNNNEFYPLYFVYYQRKPEYLTNSKYFRRDKISFSPSLEEIVRIFGDVFKSPTN
ncbi:uncharacterized protein LOC100159417 [Acyrthosiphon pisum]|uniref:PARP catalytic domain-containing protein n=1 Tax=Acyrthosiphon pisum TaxID=7029 RepID=A0A8R2A4U5_ACYPI|nr:uncharacterized protein LOC100159417 [Acyrthosiphon pisum]XP_016658841.1 uncharacterized protein LOC100159417 [Acyrthosiphon pisum]XP_029341936.1 uncharacterized protein LOC100159417 [Acyrthosiphon pisum]|eukprot:XP_003240369.1 PREDICTED: uncharacterized protein LOC100159417 [Acyrthosiphon pisum]